MEKVADLRDESGTERIGNGLLVSVIVFLYIISTCFFYGDQITNSAQSVLFWDSLLHGRALNAYQDVLDKVGSEIGCPLCYEPLAYLILGIVNLPSVIFYEMGILNISSFSFWLFVKLQQIAMVLIAAFYVYKISSILSKGHEADVKFSVVLFLLSPGLIYFAIIIGQMEIYAITFALIGIYYWLKGDSIKFVLFFAISVTFKMFTFLIFVPLVLIREKKLLKIVIYCCSGLWLLIIPKILYSQSDAYTASLAESKNRIKSLISANSFINDFWHNPVSIFIIAIIIIYVLAYLCKSIHEREWGIYYSFVSLVALFITAQHSPHWIVVITPFIPLFTAIAPKKNSMNVILSLLFWSSYLFLALLYFPSYAAFEMTNQMAIPRVFGFTDVSIIKYHTLFDFFKDAGLSKYSFLASAIYMGAAICLVIVNCPKLRNVQELFSYDKLLIAARAIVIIPIIVGMIFIYYKQNDAIVDTLNMEGEGSANIFSYMESDDKDTLKQVLSFDGEYKLDRLVISLGNSGQNFVANGLIVIKLVEDTSKTVVFTKKIGYNEIINGEYTQIKLSNVIVNSRTKYDLIIKPDKFMNMPYSAAFVGITKDKKLSGELFYYGQDTGKSLMLKINGEKIKFNERR